MDPACPVWALWAAELFKTPGALPGLTVVLPGAAAGAALPPAALPAVDADPPLLRW